MFQLLNPIALSAIAALSIPLIIHLWNIRPGKTLKVGTIALITAASRKSSRSFKVVDVLLLILRCLFLLMLAFLLAQPFWLQRNRDSKLKGWLLIPKQNTHEAYQHFKPKVDSLTKASFELHYFNSGFSKLTPDELKQLQSGTLNNKTINPDEHYWQTLRLLSQKAPAGLPVYIITPNTLSSFKGNRPQTDLKLSWLTYTPADSASHWLQRAWLSGGAEDVHVVEGNSTPSGSMYSYATLQAGGQSSSAYQVSFDRGKLVVSYKNAKGTVQKNIIADTSALRIAIVSDKSSNDAHYLSAALNAVKQFTQAKIIITTYANAASIAGKTDWIFWLSAQAPGGDVAKKTAHLFICEAGKVEDIDTWLNIPGNNKVPLYKRVAAAATYSKAIWFDGFGVPVLSIDAQHPAVYHFYSRFDPAWNDLVWSDKFPEVMLKLLMDSPVGDNSKYDKRGIGQQQIQPLYSNEGVQNKAGPLNAITDLSKAFWLTLVLLFFVERWLAHRTKTIENHG